ncbi:MAG: TetR/AcrR family transcriptional regulator [Spirochaetia bacterium]
MSKNRKKPEETPHKIFLNSGNNENRSPSDAMEEHIILSAIAVIDQDGIHGATVRKIAEAAEVNVAAISYYFRGKERLIQKAMEKTLQNAFNFSDFSESQDFGPKARLIHVMNSVVTVTLKFPGIARAHFYDPLINNDYSGTSMFYVKRFLDRMIEDLLPRYEIPPDRDELKTALTQIFSSTLIISAILPGFPSFCSDLNIQDQKDRLCWISEIVNKMLPN